LWVFLLLNHLVEDQRGDCGGTAFYVQMPHVGAAVALDVTCLTRVVVLGWPHLIISFVRLETNESG
jgi:hypothetical protein